MEFLSFQQLPKVSGLDSSLFIQVSLGVASAELKMIRVPESRSEGMTDEQDMAEWTFSKIVQSDAKSSKR